MINVEAQVNGWGTKIQNKYATIGLVVYKSFDSRFLRLFV